MEDPNDLIVLIIFATFLKFLSPFRTCNNQLQGWTGPPPACLFLYHFCVVLGFADAVGSLVIILNNNNKNNNKNQLLLITAIQCKITYLLPWHSYSRPDIIKINDILKL